MIGHAVLFLVAGFVQFNYALNKGLGSAMLFLAAVGAGVYFLGWWALLTFIAGGIVGGRLAIEQIKKDAAEHAEIEHSPGAPSMTEASEQVTNQEFHFPAFPPDEPIIIDGCDHWHYRQEFHFDGQGFCGRIHAAILNWLRRNSD